MNDVYESFLTNVKEFQDNNTLPTNDMCVRKKYTNSYYTASVPSIFYSVAMCYVKLISLNAACMTKLLCKYCMRMFRQNVYHI